MAAADVFVLSSRWEGTAGVLIEALALEVPIVASDLPGVREIVGQAARLVRSADAELLTRALVAQLTSDDQAATTKQGRARFEELFTIDRASDGMLAFYERALTGAH
jgi:glycosyltransferase involved in cell wall biosynthesis